MKEILEFLKSIIKKFLIKFNLILLFKEDYLQIDLQNLKKSFLQDTWFNNKFAIENLLSHFLFSSDPLIANFFQSFKIFFGTKKSG